MVVFYFLMSFYIVVTGNYKLSAAMSQIIETKTK